ncbi:N-alpha-acetyltransferase 30-like [Homalodisca vitripennis]|uniref:N-alpha-acetyltransferase 30-like n=1 Tax=Homalodisca vitripennis TaxID=197043 RepID=UPI001EEB9E1A|nr:N-alpha-acetyltransferase 30-like [Homalodisca vitripennis]
MENCKEILDSDCSVTRDLKVDVVLDSSMSCVSEQIDLLDQTVEDKNRNITLIKSKSKLVLEDKQIPTSSEKEKSNVIGLHVGPNGLLNGLEIENSANLSNLFDHIPKSEMHEPLCTPSSSHVTQKISCERKSGDVCDGRTKDLRTDKDNTQLKSECLSASTNCSVLDTGTLDVHSDNSREQCNDKESEESGVEYVSYKSELQMPDIMRLIQKDLSEPYSIYTYRYFIHNWPKLCFLAMDGSKCVGAIVCKLDIHRKVVKRGYIAMLAVDEKYRKRKIGSNLVLKAIRAMVADDADEVVLETEITNRPALRLYENLGFVRDKRLFRYYLNGVDALRLKLWLR